MRMIHVSGNSSLFNSHKARQHVLLVRKQEMEKIFVLSYSKGQVEEEDLCQLLNKGDLWDLAKGQFLMCFPIFT